ncbi:MAG: response regulator [Polyangiaceae bacterium]
MLPPAAPAPSSTAPPDAVAKHEVSVLVVDDDEDIRDLLVEILRGEGYSVATATHGQEALEVLGTMSPRLILLDLNMPVMGGIEFNDARLRDPILRTIPTIVMTAADRIQSRVAGLEVAGAVAKPIHLAQLLGLVARYCDDPGASS